MAIALLSIIPTLQADERRKRARTLHLDPLLLRTVSQKPPSTDVLTYHMANQREAEE